MEKIKKRATILNIVGNILLFIVKITVGVLYNSIVIISDALNSLLDIVSSGVIYLCVKVASESADKDHPFGHKRAEPIAALIVAVLTFVLGFEVIQIAFERLIAKKTSEFGIIPLVVLFAVILTKLMMYLYAVRVGKKTGSTAILASAIDHRNDIVISAVAIIGFSGSFFGFASLEPLAAILIGLWILWVGFSIGMQNLKFLMGEAPKKELLEKIRKAASKVKGVKSVQEVKAHYVGTSIQAEVHINVNRKLTVYRAHTLGKKVEKEVEKLKEVEKAFVHIDPVIKSRPH
ncbi:cation diffusion facilitator family transporter [Candidatus Woesearchaeota archaeon]|nr:cation diffusion facilitator family transporter [Candidatus Woesearchaeota archaeon]